MVEEKRTRDCQEKKEKEKTNSTIIGINTLLLMQDALLPKPFLGMNDGSATLLVLGVSNGAVLVVIANLGLAEAVQLARAHRVEVDGEGEGDEETHQRDDHGNVIVLAVGYEPRDGREQGPARDRGHDPG